MDLREFKEQGYIIIDDFLEKKLASVLLSELKNEKNWFRIDQERDHYKEGGPFNLKSKYFPGTDEKYFQNSWRAQEYEKSKKWRDFFKNKFLDVLSNLFTRTFICDATYIIKYEAKDFSRIHTDDLRGEVNRVDIGLLYYLCDDWKWDWGGNLMIAKNENDLEMKAILPIHNRLIILNNQKRCPHYISHVAEYAKNNRFTVASFIGCDKPLDNSCE